MTRSSDGFTELKTKIKINEKDRGYLGITGFDVISDYAESFDMPMGAYVKEVQKNGAADLAEIKRAKLQYKNKIEERLGSNNLKAAWDGVKRMTGLHKTQNKPVHIPMYKSDSDLSEALNTFFSRFDIISFKLTSF